MKRKKSSPSANLLKNRHGKARFYKVPKPRSRWKNPKVPEHEPNWLVRFMVGGETWQEMAGPLYPVDDGLDAVKVWAATVMETKLEALRQNKLDELEAVVRPAGVVSLAKLGEVYLSNVPPKKPDYRKNFSRLAAIFTESTGRAPEAIDVTDAVFSRQTLLNWVRMRQEHFRRGWTVKGAAPEDAWQQLRLALKAGQIPGIDKDEVMECNTTIKTYLRCAKAVFANDREYLVGLELPKLEKFMGFTVDVTAPEGHREIPADVLEALRLDAERLLREEPKVWAFNQVMVWTGARPKTVRALPGSALFVLSDGTGEIALPAAKGGKPVRVAVDQQAVAALRAVLTPDSLIGARHKTEANQIYIAHNGWLKQHGVEGTQISYQLRHMRLQQYREHGGVELAAAGGGHRTTAMVERKYTEGAKVIPMVDPRTGRRPWIRPQVPNIAG